jgi:micrococcal nuclease
VASLALRAYAKAAGRRPGLGSWKLVNLDERFVEAQRAARRAGRGFWSACPSAGGGEDEGVGGAGGGCDPSYPTVCIPPPPPDLDCADVSATGFRVQGEDPHGFDGDGDGIGCEG